MRMLGKTRTARAAAMLLVVLTLTVWSSGASSRLYASDRTTTPSGWYNTDYIYAATRGLNDMDVHPGLKVTLVPVTLVLDTAFLPFALIIGCFGH
jgi:uncharacterized protein YceK